MIEAVQCFFLHLLIVARLAVSFRKLALYDRRPSSTECIYVLWVGLNVSISGTHRNGERELHCGQRTSLSEIPSANTHYRITHTSPTGTENVTGHTLIVIKLLHNQRDR